MKRGFAAIPYVSLAGLMLTATTVAGDSRASAIAFAEYFHELGPLQGTLKSEAPLPLYDADPSHLWNRMFSAFYIRPRDVPATDEQPAMVRYEGGDVIEFLAWGTTKYWSSEAVYQRVNPLLDEFLSGGGSQLIVEPLKRVVFQHDLWVFQQCADCHMGRRLERLGVASIPSIIHSGGFDAGAQMGVARPLNPQEIGERGKRVARYKSRHESYRRLLEYLGK